MSNRRRNKKKSPNKGQSKQMRKQSVSKKMLDKLRLAGKVQNLENWAKGIDESRRREATFQANLMFSVNGLVEALCSKRHLNQDLEARAAIDALINTVIGDDEERMAVFEKQRAIYLEEYQAEMQKIEGPQGPMLLTMDDLEQARVKVIEDYRKEELAAKAAEEAKKEAESKAAAESSGEDGKETEADQLAAGEPGNGTAVDLTDDPESPSEALEETSEPTPVPSEPSEAQEAPETPTEP